MGLIPMVLMPTDTIEMAIMRMDTTRRVSIDRAEIGTGLIVTATIATAMTKRVLMPTGMIAADLMQPV